MRRRPPRSTRTDTLFPYTTLFRSLDSGDVTSHFEINRSEDTNGLHLRSFGPGCAGAGAPPGALPAAGSSRRSEEHTSELQSLMRISYAVFCLKKKTNYLQLYKTV